MPVIDSEFRKALGTFASGVTVVTARNEAGQPVGVTVSAFSSVSLEPPLIVVCLDKRTRAIEVAGVGGLPGKSFAVHILADTQQDLSNHFASRTEDRFAGIDWQPSAAGVPLLAGCLARLECTQHSVVEAGDHVLLVGLVEGITLDDNAQPLLYFRGSYRQLELS